MAEKFGGKVSGEVLTNGAPDVLDNLASNFSGVLSTKQTARFASGARTTLKINGKLIGFAFSISWNIMTTQDEIQTIDDYVPFEFAPKRIHVEGTIGMLHIPGSGASAQLIQPNVLSFLAHRYITIEVRDSATDELLFYTNKAVVTGRSEDLRSEQLGTVSLNWKAIGWKDEIEPTLPSGIKQTVGAGDSGTSALLAGVASVAAAGAALGTAGSLFGAPSDDGDDEGGNDTSGGDLTDDLPDASNLA